jgi:hypothetical protein
LIVSNSGIDTFVDFFYREGISYSILVYTSEHISYNSILEYIPMEEE